MTKSNFSWPALLSVALFTSLVWTQPLPGGPRAPSLFLIVFGAVLLFRKKVTFSDIRMQRMLIILALIWVPTCISTFTSYEPEKSLQLVVMLPLFLLASVAGYHVLDNYLTQKLLLGIITILCCFWIFDASIQLIFGKDLFGIELFDGRRVNAPFKHLRLGLFVSILLPVVLVQLERYGLFWQALYLLVSIVIVTSTGIRTNLLIVILAVGLYIIGKRKAGWLLIVIPFILVAGVLAASFSDIAQKKLNSFSQFPTTYDDVNKLSSYRLDIWEASSNMLLENPFAGVGARSFSEAFNDHSSPGNRFHKSERRAHHTHHPIISIAAETGFPGLFGFLIAVYMLARWGRDSASRALANPWAQILILIAFPIQSMPIFFTLWWFPFIIFVLICYLHTIQLKASESVGNEI
ncbi:MAG: O-antigen ligase family protein [Pseudomonadales bacterium]|nr:O-antigen ligase family protein [Pseudomonadales bacterium]